MNRVPLKKRQKHASQFEKAETKTESSSDGGSAVATEENKPPAEKEDVKPDTTNIFNVQIVEGKRSRNLPASEQKLHDWLESNFEERDEPKLVTSDIYSAYLETCTANNLYGVDQFFFSKTVNQLFKKGVGLKDDSVYHDVLKEKKIRVKKPKPAIQADTFKLKMREIIEASIKELNNPRRGLRFHTLIKHVASKYPALRIDLRPNMLKKTLTRAVYNGWCECVRGIGACGYYRLPGPPENPEEEEEEERKAKAKKDSKKKKKDEKEEKEGIVNGDVETDKTDDEADEKDKEEKDAEKKTDEEDGEKSKSAKKKRKRYTKKEHHVVHSDPKRIEDCFQLAMVFMVEPKEASVGRIKKYIVDNYRLDVTMEQVRKVIDQGMDKGYWDIVQGQKSRVVRLEMDSVDPSADDDMIGKISNALIACTEPKQCSVRVLKRYLIEYYPEFKIADRPKLLRNALTRAVQKGILVQMSGLGASGSYKLGKSFTPSPMVLQGNDTESDYETDIDAVDRYVPRPSKKHARAVTSHRVQTYSTPDSKKRKASTKRGSGRVKSSKSKTSDSSDESDDSDRPRKRRAASKRAGRKARKTTSATNQRSSGRKRSVVAYAEIKQEVDDESKSEESDAESSDAKTPPKRASPAKRGRKGRQESRRASRKTTRKQENADVSSDEEPSSKRGRKSTQKSSKIQDDDISSDEEPAPKRGRKSTQKSSKQVDDKSDDEEPSSRRGRKSTQKSSKIQDEALSSDEESAPKRGRKSTQKSSKIQDDESGEEEPSSKRGRKSTQKSSKQVDDKSDDEEPSSKRGRKSTQKSSKIQDEALSSDEESAPKRGRKSSQKSSKKDDDESGDDEPSSKRGRKSTQKSSKMEDEGLSSDEESTRKRGRKSSQKSSKMEEEDVSSDEEPSPKRGKKPSRKTPSKRDDESSDEEPSTKHGKKPSSDDEQLPKRGNKQKQKTPKRDDSESEEDEIKEAKPSRSTPSRRAAEKVPYKDGEDDDVMDESETTPVKDAKKSSKPRKGKGRRK